MMVEKLQELGYDISFERVRELADDGVIARPHVAKAMVEAGIVPTEKEAFDRFISDDGIAYVPKHALDPIDSLDLIAGAGGICVLAHPGMWKGAGSVPDDADRADGRRWHGRFGGRSPRPRRDAARLLPRGGRRLDLIPTGASDCHGARYDYRMGCETTDAERFAELQRRAGR